MCKSDAPRSTMSCRRSAILAAIVPPYHRKCPALRQGNSQHFLDRRSSFNDLHEPSLPQRPHTRRLGDRPQLGGPLVLEDGVAELLADRHDLVDRDAPLHSREVTGRAALALVELHLPLPGRDVSILDEAFLVGVVGLPALFAYLPSQSLGQDEQQRRRHQERRNPHVEESRDRRGAIVGVQGGEDQMAGERGANTDLRGLEVARLTDEDHVGVLTEEGAERGGERPADALVDLDLVDALQVVLDRILGGHDVHVRRIDRVDPRVERGGLAGPGRSGDQYHAVRLVNRRVELVEAPLVEAELRQVELQRLFVEDSEDRLLAEDRGQGRDTEVDLAVVVAQLDTAVLRKPALGDVEVRHDLQAREDRRFQPLRRGQHLVQHAVHPEADAEDLLVRLEVNVGGALLDCLDKHHVDQLHHRRFVGRLLQLEDIDLGAFLALLDDLDIGQVRLHVRQDGGDGLRLRLVVPVDRLLDRRLRRDQWQHLEVRHERDVVEREHVRGIRHRERQRVPHLPDRDDLVLARDRRRHELEHVRIDVELSECDRRDAVLSRQEPDELVFVNEVEADENRAELFGKALLFRERFLELFRREKSVRDEEVPEAAIDKLPELHLLLSHCNLLLYPTQSFQRIGKGLVRIVLIKHENDSLQAARTALQMRHHGVEHRARGHGRRDMPDPGPERGKRQRRDPVLGGQRQYRARRRGDLLAVRLEVGTHDRGVDHVGRGQIAAGGQHRLADLDGSLPHRLFLDDDAALALDGARDARRHRQCRARRVDDRVDLPVGDVAALDRD